MSTTVLLAHSLTHLFIHRRHAFTLLSHLSSPSRFFSPHFSLFSPFSPSRTPNMSPTRPRVRPRLPMIDAGRVAAARRASHAPVVPSPLNPISVNAPPPKRFSTAPLHSKASAVSLPVPAPLEVHPLKTSASADNTRPRPALLRQAVSMPLRAPRSVRHLGADYTRYFGPLHPSDARESVHLMAGAVDENAVPDPNRISDPFGDQKRVSDPLEMIDQRSRRPFRRNRVDDLHTRANIHAEEDAEKRSLCSFIDDRFGAPGIGFPLITDVKEDDDDFHTPRWDDDIRLAPKFRDYFTRENISSTVGLSLMLLGLLSIFVVLPVLSGCGLITLRSGYETPLDQMPGHEPSEPWAHIDDRKHPLLQHTRRGLIDPATPASALTRTGVHGDTYELVFSDEFNTPNRTFYPGDDPYWFGFDGWYGATQDLEWYDPDAITTSADGVLTIRFDQFASHGLAYRSGMLNSWNQLCFTGGIFEVSMSLPGPAGIQGLWPGIWTLGNLGRPGYLATTDGLWPYTYTTCDAGITPNQSMTDGTSFLPGQRLPSCTCPGADHPSPGRGRGAPEIDIAEVSADATRAIGIATQSLQVAPFDIWQYPNYEYTATPHRAVSGVNSWTGGPFQQAVSAVTTLNNAWYDGAAYQRFAFEYHPGTSPSSFISWTLGAPPGVEMFRLTAPALSTNGNIGPRPIPLEPLSLILNLGMSPNWAPIDAARLRFPAVLRVDHVRWYQLPDARSVTCDPPDYPTTEYIARHPRAYQEINTTTWTGAGYDWPANALMQGCAG